MKKRVTVPKIFEFRICTCMHAYIHVNVCILFGIMCNVHVLLLSRNSNVHVTLIHAYMYMYMYVQYTIMYRNILKETSFAG